MTSHLSGVPTVPLSLVSSADLLRVPLIPLSVLLTSILNSTVLNTVLKVDLSELLPGCSIVVMGLLHRGLVAA